MDDEEQNAVEAGPDAEPTEGDLRMLEDAVRVAELQVGRFTGLPAPVDVAQVRAVRRAGWVNANAESLKALLEPAAQRLTEAIARSAGDQLPPEMAQFSMVLRQLSPLLLGTQIGQVLGMLAQRVLGQYDIAVPRSGPGQLLFVVPNLAAFERDWSLDPREFRTFVALHEVTHRFEFSQGWARVRFQEPSPDSSQASVSGWRYSASRSSRRARSAGSSIGTSASTRRSRLRVMRSAEPIQYS